MTQQWWTEADEERVARAIFGDDYWDDSPRESHADIGRYGPTKSERIERARAALVAMTDTIRGGADALEGLWESNTLTGQLRERGFEKLADEIAEVYEAALAELDTAARPKTETEPAAPPPPPEDWAAWGRAATMAVQDAETAAALDAVRRDLAPHLLGYAEWNKKKHDSLVDFINETADWLAREGERAE